MKEAMKRVIEAVVTAAVSSLVVWGIEGLRQSMAEKQTAEPEPVKPKKGKKRRGNQR